MRSFYFVVSVQIPASRIVAAIFLELAFTAEIRVMLSQQSAPGMSVDIEHRPCVNTFPSEKYDEEARGGYSHIWAI